MNPLAVELAVGLLQPLVTMGASVVAAWFVKRLADAAQQRTGIEVEAKHREALHSALETALNVGLQKLSQRGRAAYGASAFLGDSLDYVHRSVPDAVRHFGVSDRMLGQMLQAKLTAARRGEAGTATGSTPGNHF
jgi:hypothetical protein